MRLQHHSWHAPVFTTRQKPRLPQNLLGLVPRVWEVQKCHEKLGETASGKLEWTRRTMFLSNFVVRGLLMLADWCQQQPTTPTTLVVFCYCCLNDPSDSQSNFQLDFEIDLICTAWTDIIHCFTAMCATKRHDRQPKQPSKRNLPQNSSSVNCDFLV